MNYMEAEGKELRKITRIVLYVAGAFALVFQLISVAMFYLSERRDLGEIYDDAMIDAIFLSTIGLIYPLIVTWVSYHTWVRLRPCSIISLVLFIGFGIMKMSLTVESHSTIYSTLLFIALGIVEYIMMLVLYGHIPKPPMTYVPPLVYPPPMMVAYQPAPVQQSAALYPPTLPPSNPIP